MILTQLLSGGVLYFVTSISIVLAVTLTHFWPFRVFLVEIQNAKTGLLRCSLYTHSSVQQTAVICKRCNCNKKRTIKTNSWKLFVRGFIQRLNKTGFTVLPYRFACILIYRHFSITMNSTKNHSIATNWKEELDDWCQCWYFLNGMGLNCRSPDSWCRRFNVHNAWLSQRSHNDFSISRKKRSSIPSKMLLDASVFQIMDQIIFFPELSQNWDHEVVPS